MPTWLILIIIGAVLLIIGVAVEAAKVLIWIGIAVLVVRPGPSSEARCRVRHPEVPNSGRDVPNSAG